MLLLLALLNAPALQAQLSVKATTWRAATVLEFTTDSLVVTDSSTGHNVARYLFQERADTLIVQDVHNSGTCKATLGVYQEWYDHSGQWMRLRVGSDPCASRVARLTSSSAFDFVAPADLAARDWYASGPPDGIAGISLYQAYELLAGRQSSPVIVAVIDNGVDIEHEDLRGVIWTNTREVPGNGIDDDHNGYIDDVHGWNFRGTADGTVVEDEQAAATQAYVAWKPAYDTADTNRLDAAERRQWGAYQRARQEFLEHTGADADTSDLKVLYNPIPVSSQRIEGDDPSSVGQRSYGSPVWRLSPNLSHGTHVAGIIAAERGNGIGSDGIADNVRIMPILATTAGGDERDNDVANAIRYAVDNGAQVINMSFSKLYSPQKQLVDDAVKYAEQRHVLIVHAGGNSGADSDSIPHYPTATDAAGRRASNFINVGWSRSRFDQRLAHPNSDYGPASIDLFAPGSDIFAPVPGNGYDFRSGSSDSAPIVTGVVALLLSYFPSLSSDQVQAIVLESSFRPDIIVNRPGSKVPVPFASLSATGGIVNAAGAVRMAIARTERDQ